MLNLQNVKAVFFDFDDTLCIHSIHKDWDVIINEKSNSNIFDENGCKDNTQMKEFVKKCQQAEIEMHLISATNEARRKLKLEWVKNHYGVSMMDSCTSSHSEKAHKMIEYCQKNGIKPNEILYVDDMDDNMTQATVWGIQACSPMEIVNYVNGEA